MSPRRPTPTTTTAALPSPRRPRCRRAKRRRRARTREGLLVRVAASTWWWWCARHGCCCYMWGGANRSSSRTTTAGEASPLCAFVHETKRVDAIVVAVALQRAVAAAGAGAGLIYGEELEDLVLCVWREKREERGRWKERVRAVGGDERHRRRRRNKEPLLLPPSRSLPPHNTPRPHGSSHNHTVTHRYARPPPPPPLENSARARAKQKEPRHSALARALLSPVAPPRCPSLPAHPLWRDPVRGAPVAAPSFSAARAPLLSSAREREKPECVLQSHPFALPAPRALLLSSLDSLPSSSSSCSSSSARDLSCRTTPPKPKPIPTRRLASSLSPSPPSTPTTPLFPQTHHHGSLTTTNSTPVPTREREDPEQQEHRIPSLAPTQTKKKQTTQ